MTILKKTLIATTASFLALSGAAYAQSLDVAAERLDLTNDQDSDGTVSEDELIRANAAFFDLNGDGAVDAQEREVAEETLSDGNATVIEAADLTEMMAGMEDAGLIIEFDVGEAQLDETLDTDSDGVITTDEIIEGNMALFDTDNNGAIDADERIVAEEVIMNGASASVDAMTQTGEGRNPELMSFDADQARLDQTNDQNGDGEVSNDEIIRMNMDLFDTDENGAIDADEREVAEEILEQG